ncbi:hypothetical protein [Legionella saoudiensis]|uniref:hypothetical protein n=1 Tax=Legionella saoudiensis TaxID=1750561 RepID=UPI0007318C68|nr:hypothetical protein [Legionella saoudiensis]
MTNTTPQTPSAINPQTSKAEQIKTHERLIELQQALDEALDAFSRDHSQLTQMATYWGKQPLWWRISLGVTIIVPLILFSMVMQLAVLLTISLFISAIYIIGNHLLVSHHQHALLNIQKFKNIVISLNSLQSSMIELTHELHEQLKQELEQVGAENMKLTDNVSRLTEELLTLSLTLEQLKITEAQQKKLVHHLETNVEQLMTASEAQSNVYEQTHTQLETVRKEYEQTQTLLLGHIERIGTLESQMESERMRTQNTIQILKNTLGKFTGMMLLSEEQRMVFEKKMTDFIENNHLRFKNLVEVLSQTTTQISETTERYTEATTEFHQLLNQQKQLFNQLESVVERIDEPETPIPPVIPCTPSQTRFGLFSEKESVDPLPKKEPKQVSEIKVF